MAADLLRGVTVLEASLFSPDALGGHLADLGAQVIKVDQPGGGGFRGPMFAAGSLQDRQWNRGKQSVTINLKLPDGQALFRRLAASVDVVVDGLRHGAADRFGFGYSDIVAVNPTVVYCTLNGMGGHGPYADLPTHGLSFDCFAGLTPPVFMPDGSPRLPGLANGTIGVLAGPLYAAVGVLAALLAVKREGVAQYVEVAQVDAAIAWNFQNLTPLANGEIADNSGIRDSVRYQYYETADGNFVVFNALEDKFWLRFCEEVGRSDLVDPGRLDPTTSAAEIEKLRKELADIFRARTRSEWTQFFIETNIAGAPAFLDGDLFDDPHVLARGLIYEQASVGIGVTRMLDTCIKTDPSSDSPPGPAPRVGEHTDEILRRLAGCGDDELRNLREAEVI